MRRTLITFLFFLFSIALHAKSETANTLQLTQNTEESKSGLQTLQKKASTLNDEQIRGILAKAAKQGILPLYQESFAQAKHLQETIEKVCQQPSEINLNLVKEQWGKALGAWQKALVARFGPTTEEHIDLRVYFYPIKKSQIKSYLKQNEPVTLAMLRRKGVGAQGFATLEYLLFSRDSNTPSLLTSDFVLGTQKCHYLQANVAAIVEVQKEIYTQWDKKYADAIQYAGTSKQAEFIEAQQALELLVGKLDQMAVSLSKRLGKALGKAKQLSGKDPERSSVNPHQLEAWRSGKTLAIYHANIAGIQHLLNQGGLLEPVKVQGHHELIEKLQNNFNAIEQLQFENGDLFHTIEQKKLAQADQLYDALLLLSSNIKQLAKILGVQLGFNDQDGD